MATEGESFIQRQNDEVSFLKAVYMDDVVDQRQFDVWKVKRPPDLKIHLGPQESMHAALIHVHLDLLVKCSKTYPDEVPELKLDNSKGLSNQALTKLKKELDDLAESQKGEVMIYELCQHVQNFLHTHNKPPAQSFYEEMMSNKKKQEERETLEQQRKEEILKKKEERELQDIEDEMKRRKEDTRRRREEAKQVERNSLSEPSTPVQESRSITPIPKDSEQRLRIMLSADRVSPSTNIDVRKAERRRRTSTPLSGRTTSESEDHICQDHAGTVIMAFNTKKDRSVCRGKCIGHCSRGNTLYAGMDTKTGELVAVSEWLMSWHKLNRRLDLQEKEEDAKHAAAYAKQLAAVETELYSLLKLTHRNLVQYLAMKNERHPGQLTVNVLVEFVGGGSLSHYLHDREVLQLDILRHYTIQLLEVLAYLHDKAVVHKDLRTSSILIESGGVVRLTDYSLTKRLADMTTSCNSQRKGVTFEDNLPPTLGRGGKKGDIYRLGVVLLSLAQGAPVEDRLPTVPSTLSQDFQEFLTKCLIRDEHHRWSAHELLEHSFVKTPIYHITAPPKKTTEAQSKSEEDSDSEGEVAIPYIPASDSGSRLQNEFAILKWLGKGGFGDVIKVKNKLDGRFYAIKRIPLNPRSKLFRRKITREVKLLSRLSHENVVRYYNSWIETSTELAPSDTSSTFPGSRESGVQSPFVIRKEHKPPSPTKEAPTVTGLTSIHINSLGFQDNFENLAPPVVDQSVEWSISADVTGNDGDDEDMSSDDDDEDDVFGKSFLPYSSDSSEDGVVFEQDEDITTNDCSEVTSCNELHITDDKTDDSSEKLPKLQFLYIQMEFCEKSTLRNSIDAGLYEDMNRVLRLFREMVEGLTHIHDQGIIHRDLKPVNIFLDSNDHVKIGDFGLATTNIISKEKSGIMELSMNPLGKADTGASQSDNLGDSQLTGKVGTALYASPEVMNSSFRIVYNQKVDVYSLGIMFFEMCYKPLDTGMERVKILGNLRLPNIIIPEDFAANPLHNNQLIIIRWLLNHDPANRPTAKELLASRYMPPPQFEEAELNEVLRSTISNPESKHYKRLLVDLLSQPGTSMIDTLYDHDIYKMYKPSTSTHTMLIQQHVLDVLHRIYRRHGAICLQLPLLMPSSTMYQNTENYCRLMDHNGEIISLAYDLRAPFARFVARRNLTKMKRYTIDKVFRQARSRSHPKEVTACSFDIVSSNPDSVLCDAEVIYTIEEIINEFPALSNNNYYLRLNHTSLVKALLLYCGIPEEKYQQILAYFGEPRVEKLSKVQMQTHLCSTFSLDERAVETLYRFMEIEAPFNQVSSKLRVITRTKGKAGSLAKEGMHELEVISSYLQAFGCKLQVQLALGQVYSLSHFAGAFYQVVWRKKKESLEVLAAGGRYNPLVDHFCRTFSTSVMRSVVGVSVSVDRVVQAAMKQEEQQSAPCDVLVCPLGGKSMAKEKLLISLTKDLWNAGLRADILHQQIQSLEDIPDICKEDSIPFMILLKDASSGGSVQIRSRDKDHIAEKKVAISEVVEYLSQRLDPIKLERENSDSGQGRSQCDMKWQGGGGESGQTGQHISSGSGHNLPTFIISFITQESTKLAKNTRRTYEASIYATISKALGQLSVKSHVEVVAVNLNLQVLKTIAAYLDLNGEESAFEMSIGSVIEKHARHRKYLTKIFDTIYKLKFENNCPVILLYGLKDDSYRILL